MSTNANEIKIHVSDETYDTLASLAEEGGYHIQTFLRQVIEQNIEESICCAKAMLRYSVDCYTLALYFGEKVGFVKVEFSRDGSFFIDLYFRKKNEDDKFFTSFRCDGTHVYKSKNPQF